MSVRDKFRELESAECSQAVVKKLRKVVTSGSDIDCYKINVFRLADELDVSRREALRAFLFATRLGVMDMHYDIHCPSCRGLPEFYKHLMGLRNKAHCLMCEIDIDVDFEKQVEVTFTVSPNVRRINFKHYKDRDFKGRLAYYGEIVAREGRVAVAGDCLNPGETKTLRGYLEPGSYHYAVPRHMDRHRPFKVSGRPVKQAQPVKVTVNKDGSINAKPLNLRPGPADFVVTYNYPEYWGIGVKSDKPLPNWVSAAYVTSQQDFRDLFSGEFLAEDTSFAIKNVTLMFTDIKASTEMYEKLGDSRAYAVVKDHFRLMRESIRGREGGVVKTIGDAVMASFPVNADAVKAARAIQRAFRKRALRGVTVEVKIGLHRGPAIAVTDNRNLDYFGRTVNIAARVQGQSAAGEVLASDSVVEDPDVQAFLKREGLRAKGFGAKLKGLGARFRLYRLTVAG